MIDEPEALETILATTPAAEPERLPLRQALGRYLCEPLRAEIALPGFDQSSMDGYAIRAEDLDGGKGSFRVVGTVAAGGAEKVVCGEMEAVRVFTGAPLPEGADTVIMQEDVRLTEGGIDLLEETKPGEFVRYKGEVICRGQAIGNAGDPLDSGRIGLFASQGIESVLCGSSPKIAVLTTGDELVAAGEPLSHGQIYNSNGEMLCAAAKEAGGNLVHVAHVGDSLAATTKAISEAMELSDVLLVAGGVSVGDRDFVKPALAECGVDPIFWRVRVRPGKPLLYAKSSSGCQVFGLPGNPVSALVCFTIFARPAIERRRGAMGDLGARRCAVTLGETLTNPTDRPHYVRGQIGRGGDFLMKGLQESHGLAGLAVSNAIVRVAAGGTLETGARVDALRLT